MKKRQNLYWLLPVFGVGVALFGLMPYSTMAATTCTFSRDLELGVVGEDVKCLQQYLNANGFLIAETGAGSPGKETGEYKTLTEAAVVRWQTANKISPASGYFGTRSRTTYRNLVTGEVSDSLTTPRVTATSGAVLVEQLLAQINSLQAQKKTVPATVSPTGTDASVRALLLDVLDAIDEAEDALDEREEDDDEAALDAKENLDDARTRLLLALRPFLSGDLKKAEDLLGRALASAEDAIDDAGTVGEKQEVSDLLAELEDRFDELETMIEEADEEGESTSEAEDLYDEAEDLYDEAETAYDDGEYEDALDLAEEAEDVLNEAEDAIGSSARDTEDQLEDARDELDDAWDQVDAALDDDKDVGDAEDYLDEAEDLLNDAETALEDDDEDEAEDLIDEALDLIEDARDEF